MSHYKSKAAAPAQSAFRRARFANVLLILAFLIPATSLTLSAQKDNKSELSLAERVLVASKIYASIPIYFAHWQNVPGLDLDDAYKAYLTKVIAATDRRDFDLASIEFVASLRNGHSGFEDNWLNEHYGQPLGFYARPIKSEWVVTESSIPVLKPGDVIQRINDEPMEKFYREKQRWLFASSDTARHQTLFLRSYLFPEAFTLTLDDGRVVSIDRSKMVAKDHAAPVKPELRNGIEYIRIASFDDPKFEFGAIDYLYKHRDARTFIIDVRGNGGGNSPENLIRALMDRPFREWSEGTPLTIGLFLAYQDLAKRPDLPAGFRNYMDAISTDFYQSQLLWAGSVKQPQEPIFTGELFILVDSDCASACEDFIAPFKDNHRATIIGESTMGSSGQPYYYDFGNGMSFRISTKREYFPDGTAFEGIGVKPDIEVPLTLKDLKVGRDAALLKAEEMARGGS